MENINQLYKSFTPLQESHESYCAEQIKRMYAYQSAITGLQMRTASRESIDLTNSIKDKVSSIRMDYGKRSSAQIALIDFMLDNLTDLPKDIRDLEDACKLRVILDDHMKTILAYDESFRAASRG